MQILKRRNHIFESTASQNIEISAETLCGESKTQKVIEFTLSLVPARCNHRKTRINGPKCPQFPSRHNFLRPVKRQFISPKLWRQKHRNAQASQISQKLHQNTARFLLFPTKNVQTSSNQNKRGEFLTDKSQKTPKSCVKW